MARTPEFYPGEDIVLEIGWVKPQTMKDRTVQADATLTASTQNPARPLISDDITRLTEADFPKIISPVSKSRRPFPSIHTLFHNTRI